MKKYITNIVSITLATVLFFLLLNTVNGQSDEKQVVGIEPGLNINNQSQVAQKPDLYSLLPLILTSFEENESSCEYLAEFPNICVVLA